MTAWTEEILSRHGQTVTLETKEGRRTVQAFLQPVRERLWLYLGREEIGPGDAVEWNGMALQVRSSRPCYIGGTLSHWRASLERRWEAAE